MVCAVSIFLTKKNKQKVFLHTMCSDKAVRFKSGIGLNVNSKSLDQLEDMKIIYG